MTTDLHSPKAWLDIVTPAYRTKLERNSTPNSTVTQVHANCQKLHAHLRLLQDEPYLDEAALQFFKWIAWRNVNAYPADTLEKNFKAGFDVLDWIERVHEETDGTCTQPTTPTTTFDDIIGLQAVKESIHLRYTLAYQYPHIANLESSGLLLYGPPGTGKTLLAQALANQPHNKLLVVTHGSLKDKYEGGTEKAIEKVFQCAKTLLRTDADTRSVFIFIDEFENIAGKKLDDPSMTRTVNTLLQMMDGATSNLNVRVVAATNYVSSLEDAVVSRFALKQFVDLPDQKEIAEVALHILSKKHTRAWGAPRDWYADSCPLKLLGLLEKVDALVTRKSVVETVKKWADARNKLRELCKNHIANSKQKDAQQILETILKEYSKACSTATCKLVSNRGIKMIIEQALESQLREVCNSLNADASCAAPVEEWCPCFKKIENDQDAQVYVYIPRKQDGIQPEPNTHHSDLLVLHLELRYLETAYATFKSEITLETYAQALLENLGVVF